MELVTNLFTFVRLFPDFLFPNNTRIDDMKICETNEIKMFCKDYVERAEIMFILATVSCGLVIMSLVSPSATIEQKKTNLDKN